MIQHRVQILADGLAFPEGPAFDPAGNLWCVELKAGNLVCCQGGLERIPTGGTPNGLAFDARGRAWFCDAGQNAIRRFDPSNGAIETVVDWVENQPLDKPNDLAFDTVGNLIFTCPGNSREEPTGYVCCLTPTGKLSKIAEGLYFPNGLAFSTNGQTLVIAETYRHRLWKGQWDAQQCVWLEPQPLAQVCEPVFRTGPDGMAFGADGLLYVAVFGTSTVKAFDMEGNARATYPMPASRPTNVAFDPCGRLGLVVTEAEQGLLLSLPELGPGLPPLGGTAWA